MLNSLRREGSLAEGEAPYICPSNTLSARPNGTLASARTSTILLHLYVVRFLTCNSFVIHFAKVTISLETTPFLPLIVVNRGLTDPI